MGSEHRFLRPNPVLLDLERAKEQKRAEPRLAHELGQGSRCDACGDACPGFQLHYWRKVCMNCRCGKAEHNVVDVHDPGFYFVGKIFDRPLRTRQEEMEFCYGASSDSDDSSNSDNSSSLGMRGGLKKSTTAPGGKKKTVRFEWVPPNISLTLARKYLEQLPRESVPIAGSAGSRNRKLQLEKQFPVHDVEPAECHDLTPAEVASMQDYVSRVKEHVVGQGVVTEITFHVNNGTNGKRASVSNDDDGFPPPPGPEILDHLADQFDNLGGPHNSMQPPPLPRKPPGASTSSSSAEGVFTAKPFNAGVVAPPPTVRTSQAHTKKNSHLLRPPYGSTSSSLDSSRNGSPSPTSLHQQQQHNDDGSYSVPRHLGSGPVSPLGRPGSSMSGRSSSAAAVTRCEECRLELFPGDVAVQADRAGKDKMWHPRCFKCFACREILVDLLYYYDSGRVFCARDYAEHARIPRCHACDELIFAPEYTGAEKRAWHIKHFCCYACDRPLAGHKYIPVDGQPHCLICYQSRHGKVCATCGEYILPQEQRISLQDEHWHASPECFCCAVCRCSLLGRKMTKKDGWVLCSSNCARRAKDLLVTPAPRIKKHSAPPAARRTTRAPSTDSSGGTLV